MPELRTFRKLLVANRGEIAIRILRAASELGIRTVAIYTYEDRYSLHRYKADESYQIGADDDPLKPYLNIPELIRTAKEHGVDAIHPGYGFLSENVGFARACREAGITFIGPSPEAMERLGDKVTSKVLARETNVPLIEDSKEPLTDVSIAVREAARIGYPIMVKAAAGGGGRGMRVVRSERELRVEYEEARNEARTAFGDDTVFLEKYIDNPKHIEVQLFGDKHGNLVHLYERDCSVQRRFQKVVEVAPAVALREETKQKLYDYALALGRAADYSAAGTVEFLVDNQEQIYFIEVNPRIQVEHTITEEITGVDLVRSQILVCQGYPLHHPEIGIAGQDSIRINGCAIQCRVTTEDPTNGFKPDYGTLIAYRSASGMGIRLDAGSAYPGAVISPFFDSLLVKVTAKGRTMADSAQRLHRALREFRVRGVKTNIDFLLNLLQNETFIAGEQTVNFIPDNPQLLELPRRRDRGTKVLNYLADVIVNGNPDVKYVEPRRNAQFRAPVVPTFDETEHAYRDGTKQLLETKGARGVAEWLRAQTAVQYTDTTLRDAHQSLLATRMRTIDMLKVSESFGRHHGHELFSMEMWGGATFDVAHRFLKESPWRRLRKLRVQLPNTLLQMLLRGSNGVGYKAYPDNLIERFIDESAEQGIDLFRIFDSLNWVENMKVSIDRVIQTGRIAEACICYSGDLTDPNEAKFTLDYYIDLAKRLEDTGAHILAIKDMAGLLKPRAAAELIPALREAVQMPIHLHTHNTSGIQSATYLTAINAGVDAVDCALASMSDLTSQPNLNSVIAMMAGHARERPMDLASLNQFSNYWEDVRDRYYPFEAELRAGTADIYASEIPGGQYSNLRPQARGLGLEERFDEIKANYAIANELFGNLVKVTPSSKVVGDMAMFMTSNNLTRADIFERGDKLDFPDSVKSLMRGDLGQMDGGFPPEIQRIVLKGETPYTDRPNAHLDPIDFDAEWTSFQEKYGEHYRFENLLSSLLYPKVFADYHEFLETKGRVWVLPTEAFFYGLEANQEILVQLSPGKTITVKFLNLTEPTPAGTRVAFFKLNGQTRAVEVQDHSLNVDVKTNAKASGEHEVGAPLQGNLSKILVQPGDAVEVDQPLFVIEAMKMESTVTSPMSGTVEHVELSERTLVAQGDLVVRIG